MTFEENASLHTSRDMVYLRCRGVLQQVLNSCPEIVQQDTSFWNLLFARRISSRLRPPWFRRSLRKLTAGTVIATTSRFLLGLNRHVRALLEAGALTSFRQA